VNSIVISLITCGCVFGAALLGIFLRAILPDTHLSDASKDTVRLGMGMIATMAALVLGLLVASAKSFYDPPSSDLTQMSANIILLDRVLARYGPETKDARDVLHGAVAHTLDLIWPQERQDHSQLDPRAASGEILFDKIQELSPQTNIQHAAHAQASSLAIDIGKIRWLLFEQGTNSVSTPSLVMLIFSLAIVFASFGLFAPTNATVMVTLFLCALSVSSAVFLILEMYTPFEGLIQIPSGHTAECPRASRPIVVGLQ
jgi:hypothetical protein